MQNSFFIFVRSFFFIFCCCYFLCIFLQNIFLLFAFCILSTVVGVWRGSFFLSMNMVYGIFFLQFIFGHDLIIYNRNRINFLLLCSKVNPFTTVHEQSTLSSWCLLSKTLLTQKQTKRQMKMRVVNAQIPTNKRGISQYTKQHTKINNKSQKATRHIFILLFHKIPFAKNTKT